MRDFNEFKAEVFRRSEKRIKERKRNRRIILASISVVICPLIILSVVALPAFFVWPKLLGTESVPADSVVADNASGESLVMFLEVTAPNTGERVVISDPRDIEEIRGIFDSTLPSLYGIPPGASQGTPDENKSNDKPNYNEPCDYVLTFVESSGKERVYKIQDGFLICQETGVKSKLADAEFDRIETIINS